MKIFVLIEIVLWVSIFGCTQWQAYDRSFIRFQAYGKEVSVIRLSGGTGNDCHQEENVALKIGERSIVQMFIM